MVARGSRRRGRPLNDVSRLYPVWNAPGAADGSLCLLDGGLWAQGSARTSRKGESRHHSRPAGSDRAGNSWHGTVRLRHRCGVEFRKRHGTRPSRQHDDAGWRWYNRYAIGKFKPATGVDHDGARCDQHCAGRSGKHARRDACRLEADRRTPTAAFTAGRQPGNVSWRVTRAHSCSWMAPRISTAPFTHCRH